MANSSRILLPATERVTDGFEPEHPMMFAIRTKKEARGKQKRKEKRAEGVRRRIRGRRRQVKDRRKDKS